MKEKVVIVDLDGTLLSVNSWPVFAKSVLMHLVAKGSLTDFVRMALLMAKRKFGLMSHKAIKTEYVAVSQSFDHNFFDKLCKSLMSRINPRVKAFVDTRAAAGERILVATAAAGEYAVKLCNMMGYNQVIASGGAINNEYIETAGEVKLKYVKEYLDTHHLEPSAIVTDSPDDLPLLKSFSEAKIYIVAATAATAATLRSHQVTFTTL